MHTDTQVDIEPAPRAAAPARRRLLVVDTVRLAALLQPLMCKDVDVMPLHSIPAGARYDEILVGLCPRGTNELHYARSVIRTDLVPLLTPGGVVVPEDWA